MRRLLEEGDAEPVLAGDGVSEMLRRSVGYSRAYLGSSRAGDEAAGTAPAGHVHAERLGAADDDVGAVVGRWREDAERDRVDPDDRLGSVPARERCDLGCVRLDPAEERGALEEDGGGARREPLLEIGQIDAAGHGIVGDELDLDLADRLGRRAVGPDHREPLRADRIGHEQMQASGQTGRHPDRVAGRAAPAVDRQPHEVHADELAQLARELEPGLVAAVVGRGGSPDRREELAPPHDLVADRRDVMLPDAAAEEVEIALARLVAREHVDQVTPEDRLRGERRRELERASHAVRGGNLGEERLDVGDADGLEQLPLQRRRRVRHVRMCSHAATLHTSVRRGATCTRR